MKIFTGAFALLIVLFSTVPAQTQLDIPGMPKPGTPPAWNPPVVQEDVLPNGLRVLYTRVNNIPTINFNFILDAGGACDPEWQTGVANLTSEMVLAGTTSKSNAELSSEFANYGTIAANNVGYHSVQYYFSSLKENFPQSLSLAVDMITNPAFDTTAFDARKTQVIETIIKVVDNPADMTTRTLLKTMFGEDVPYAYAPHGRYRDVYDLTIDDCKVFYNSRYVPSNAVLAITGDVDYKAIRSLLIDRLGTWKGGPVPPTRKFAPEVTEPQIIVIDDSQVSQAMFRLGYPCTSRGSSDFETLLLMNEVLGADRTSRLGRALFGERKLTPYVVSGPSFQRDVGYFVISGSIPSRYIDTALTVVFETIEAMKTVPATPEELFEAKKVYTDNFDLEFETGKKAQAKIHETVAYGLQPNYFQEYLKRFNSVSADDIMQAANVLFMGPWVMVITGDAGVIAPALEERYGIPVQVVFPNDVISKDRPRSYDTMEEEGAK